MLSLYNINRFLLVSIPLDDRMMKQGLTALERVVHEAHICLRHHGHTFIPAIFLPPGLSLATLCPLRSHLRMCGAGLVVWLLRGHYLHVRSGARFLGSIDRIEMYQRTYDFLQHDGRRIAHEHRHAHFAHPVAVEAVSSSIQEVCPFRDFRDRKFVRLPRTAAGDDDH